MAKLYPPMIEGKLPAFTKKVEDNSDKIIISVPFQLNMAVGRNEFNSMAIIVKNVQGGHIIADGIFSTSISYIPNNNSYLATFYLDNVNSFAKGEYYKIQVAFVKDNEVGYYSAVGVAKYTTMPTLTIEGLTADINHHQYTYTGHYSQKDRDITEKVYSYCFNLYDSAYNLIDTSGEQIHNASTNVNNYESTDSWTVNKNLTIDEQYIIEYKVTTSSNLQGCSCNYFIMQMDTTNMDIDCYLSARPDFDNGFITLKLYANDKNNPPKVQGSYVLVRSSNENNYDTWNEVYRFQLCNDIIYGSNKEDSSKDGKLIWQDFTTQQGMKYKYAIQAYNDYGLYSNRLENIEDDIYMDFESSFLYDGEKQLKICFNPKVSSFKTNVLETKVNTLGGKYPFVFRNGQVEYKEFPISGLLTYLSDDLGYFMGGGLGDSEKARNRTAGQDDFEWQGTQLTAENFRRERQFKMDVLNWLNNGKPKLFRSPSEGNYIVRLISASLSPNDTLGRMIHTFSCTANEIAECNFDNLKKYKFITAPSYDTKTMTINSIPLSLIQATTGAYPLKFGAYFISFNDQFQDEFKVKVYYADGSTSGEINITNPTGAFVIEELNDIPITAIEYLSGTAMEGATMLYGYYDNTPTSIFSIIKRISIESKYTQYIGTGIEKNIIDYIEKDLRFKAGRFYYISLVPRQVSTIYQNESKYYLNNSFTEEIKIWDKTQIYKIAYEDKWLYGGPDNISDKAPDFSAKLNSEEYTDLGRNSAKPTTSGRIEINRNVGQVEQLQIGTGIIANIGYQLKTIEYTVEDTDPVVRDKKSAWQKAESEYNQLLAIDDVSEAELRTAALKMNTAYVNYINALTNAVEIVKAGGVQNAI